MSIFDRFRTQPKEAPLPRDFPITAHIEVRQNSNGWWFYTISVVGGGAHRRSNQGAFESRSKAEVSANKEATSLATIIRREAHPVVVKYDLDV